MATLAAVVGVVIVLVSLILLVAPAALQSRLPALFSGARLYLIAIARLLIGSLLLAVAAESRHPEIMAGLGWLTVLAGLLLFVIPPDTMARIVAWYARLPAWQLRAMVPLALAYGGYIVYAVST